MKIQELKENSPLKVIEVSKYFEMPPSIFNPKEVSNPDIGEIKQIQMRVFTDGKIKKISKELVESIKEYYIGKRKYQHPVDTLKTKNIFFKDHSFVITYLIAKEYTTVGNIRGWFDIIKDVSVYLENTKDKKALKNAKQAIKEIQNHNSSVDYSSLFGMLISWGNGLEKFNPEEIEENVFSLKKSK